MADLTIGIYKGYDYPDLYRQTPGEKGVWGKARFIIDKLDEPCDILVVLNQFYEKVEVQCGEVWLVVQEPPLNCFPWVFEGHSPYGKIFTPLCAQKSYPRCQPSHGALPWHVDLNYDELNHLEPIEKPFKLSWITTNKALFPGHKDRLNFLNKLKAYSGLKFDLFGYGFQPLENKFEGLAPYRYSLAVENYVGPHYWTEKIADCFLSWSMPIYYGCTNLPDYFPKESYVQIDINDPNVFQQIKEVINSDLYLTHREAIAEARQLILEKYQLFPFITDKTNELDLQNKNPAQLRTFTPYRESFKSKLLKIIKRISC